MQNDDDARKCQKVTKVKEKEEEEEEEAATIMQPNFYPGISTRRDGSQAAFFFLPRCFLNVTLLYV